MRKYALILLFALLALLPVSACADSFTFDSIHAEVTIPEDYIFLTADNIEFHPEWVERHGTTEEAVMADFQARGVLLQAWTTSDDACLEITAVKDDLAQQYFDLDQQETSVRTAYKNGHTNGSYFGDLGYKFTSAEWKNVPKRYGRMLELKYTRTTAAGTTQGYMRRTIRNGYTVTLDYRAVGRDSKTADKRALDAVMDTFAFTTSLAKPPEIASDLVFTSKPPRETNTGKFTVKGTGDAGLHIVGVVMRMSDPQPTVIETDVNKNGSFSLDVQLPSEGVWLMTLTVENAGIVTEEVFFDTTTYQKTLLPVNMDAELPTELTSDTLTISGTTMGQTTVQCIVDGVYDKQIRTNNSGGFSFKINTKTERTYTITLVFTKKNYETRRFQTTANRIYTEEDIKAGYRAEAVKPAYSTLTNKLTGYTGRIMHYDLYCVSIEQSGDEWLIYMAMDKKKSGYKNIIVVMAEDAPPFVEDAQVHMYGRCTGSYEVTTEEKTEKYPSFDLLFWGK